MWVDVVADNVEQLQWRVYLLASSSKLLTEARREVLRKKEYFVCKPLHTVSGLLEPTIQMKQWKA
jgi:hypothetical protein